ncbi:MAG TPA: hypothetical protein VFV87_17645 [Pirellulaceae bacterium]|nr:hypothetical protein [Pirellulaceae bacterium]
MKRHWIWSGCAILALAVGCTQSSTLEDMQKAAENRMDEATEAVEKATEDAVTKVEEAGAEAKTGLEEGTAAIEGAVKEGKAAIEGATEEGKAAVEGAAADAKAGLEGSLGDLSALKVGDVEVGKECSAIAEKLKTTLASIKDVETAKEALPNLEEVNLGLDKLTGLVEQIPEAVRPALATMIKTHSAKLTESIQRVVSIEGVGEIVKPVLDQIVAKLEKVTGGAAPAEPAAGEAPAEAAPAP